MASAILLRAERVFAFHLSMRFYHESQKDRRGPDYPRVRMLGGRVPGNVPLLKLAAIHAQRLASPFPGNECFRLGMTSLAPRSNPFCTPSKGTTPRTHALRDSHDPARPSCPTCKCEASMQRKDGMKHLRRGQSMCCPSDRLQRLQPFHPGTDRSLTRRTAAYQDPGR